MNIKILLVSESPLILHKGLYYAKDPWIRFPMQLSLHCQMSLWAPVIDVQAKDDIPDDYWPLNDHQLNIIPHDPYSSFLGYFKRWPRRHRSWMKQAHSLISQHDVVLLRLPSPIISIVTKACQANAKPLVIFLAGDVETQSDRVLGSKGIKKIFYKLIIKSIVWHEKRWASRAQLIYAYTTELASRYKTSGVTIRSMRTPHMKKTDILQRQSTDLRKPIRILRVAWLLPSKGYEYLIEAIAMLTKKNFDVELNIVGKERAEGFQNKLLELAKRLGIDSRVHFLGWKTFEEIPQVFLENDIHVISSLSEGTPRVILEGAARGVPLVSTTVGGCGDTLTDRVNALLVPPKDSQAMAAALEEMINDHHLRSEIIKNGYHMAHENTFDVLGMKLLAELEELKNKNSHLLS